MDQLTLQLLENMLSRVRQARDALNRAADGLDTLERESDTSYVRRQLTIAHGNVKLIEEYTIEYAMKFQTLADAIAAAR